MNRMKRAKTIFIAICITVFIGISLLAISFIKDTPVSKDSTVSKDARVSVKKGNSHEEGFNSITRASECNCLPGYIPTNVINGRILGKEGDFITIGTPTLVRFGTDNKWIEKNVSQTFRATTRFFGSDPAPGLHKRVETITNENGVYFCLSLTDPEKRRTCY
jgi:hypothetical protein